jgi:pimeloyl-ACP methyl ester carboxylesterase
MGKDRCFTPLLSNIIKSEALDNIKKGVRQIDVPTLLIVGSNDKLIPPIATNKFLSHYIKDITVKVAVNAGHNPFKETPQQYQEFIIDFLNKINK